MLSADLFRENKPFVRFRGCVDLWQLEWSLGSRNFVTFPDYRLRSFQGQFVNVWLPSEKFAQIFLVQAVYLDIVKLTFFLSSLSFFLSSPPIAFHPLFPGGNRQNIGPFQGVIIQVLEIKKIYQCIVKNVNPSSLKL